MKTNNVTKSIALWMIAGVSFELGRTFAQVVVTIFHTIQNQQSRTDNVIELRKSNR